MSLNNNADTLSDTSGISFESFFRKHDAVFLLMNGETGQLIDVNNAALRFYGYSIQQITSMKIGDINKLPPNELETERQRAVKEERKYFIVPHLLANGAIRTVEVYSTPIILSDKKYLFSIIHDITDRKVAEEELRRTEENFRRSLDDYPLGMRIVTVEGETLYANRAILNFLGYDNIEELKAAPVMKRYTPESFVEFQIRREKRKRGDYSPSEYEISIVRKDGEVRHLQVFRKKILWDGERQYQVIYNDITERKQAEVKLHASLREKEVLLREVHHRVKNNMQVISGLLDLQAKSSGNPELIERLNESQSRIRSMALIHEKLYGSKDFARIDLAGYVRALSQDLFQSYKINPGKIDLIIQTDGAVYVDINKAIPCGLILNELISNALKHAYPGYGPSELRVIIRETKNTEIEIVVRDNGFGLPDDVDPQQPRTVGLYLVNGLVKHQLDGQIEVRRDTGTEFRIKFPL